MAPKKNPKLRSHLTWADVNGAMDSCFALEDLKPETEVPLTKVEDYQAKEAFLKGFASKGGCCACLQFLMPEADRVDGDAAYHGYLWKLSHDSLEDDSALANLNNWRRRLFFLRDHQKEGRMLAYVSEKEGGSLHVNSLLQWPRADTVKGLPKITLAALNDTERRKVQDDLCDYDVACRYGDPRGLTAAAYSVPTELWPFAIDWKDASGGTHRSVVACSSSREFDEWKRFVIDGKTLPQCLEDDLVARGSWNNAVSIKHGGEGVSIRR